VALELSSVNRPFDSAKAALGVNIIFYGIRCLDVWSLFHSSVKKIIFAFPIATFGVGLDVSFDATTTVVNSLDVEIIANCSHLVKESCSSFASDST
jgi:hypothetical protein